MRSNCSLYGTKDTPPLIYSSRLGHTSLIVDFPLMARILFNNKSVHVGTPAREVTFSSAVTLASCSILVSHSSSNAILNSGVRSHCPQKGVFCINTALRSPYWISSFILLNWWLPPITRLLPVSKLLPGKLL